MVRVPTRGTPTDYELDFMSYDPEKHHRRSIRLKGFDYSRSVTYFVTICVENRECLFGTILQDGKYENSSNRNWIGSSEW
jgi:putative transposase